MGFQLSPGVQVSEIDLTTIVPSVATTPGAVVIVSQWGPVAERVLVDSERNLLRVFQGPNNDNFTHWFTANNFLGYGNNLQVVRAVANDALNSSSSGSFTGVVLNEEDYENTSDVVLVSAGEWIGKFPGSLGNSLEVSIFDGQSTKLEFIDTTAFVSGAELEVGETVQGQTSSATATVVSFTAAAVGQPGSVLLVDGVSGTFEPGGEVLLGLTSTEDISWQSLQGS